MYLSAGVEKEEDMWFRVNTSYYQRVLLEELFSRGDVPLLEIRNRMESVLPRKFSWNTPERESVPITRDNLKQSIIDGGSLMYNRLGDVLSGRVNPDEASSYHELAKLLASHYVRELFRYAWICSLKGAVLKRGCSWFTTRKDCLEEGRKNRPSYQTFDGPGAPELTLCVESVCTCNVHLVCINRLKEAVDFPCKCFDRKMPPMLKESAKNPIVLQPAKAAGCFVYSFTGPGILSSLSRQENSSQTANSVKEPSDHAALKTQSLTPMNTSPTPLPLGLSKERNEKRSNLFSFGDLPANKRMKLDQAHSSAFQTFRDQK